MKTIKTFRTKLKSGQICLGSGITLTDLFVTEALADEVDFLWYDLEHCAMGQEVLNAHLLAARSRNKPAIVRIPMSGAGIIKQILDAGAHGIVVPQLKTVEQAQEFVSFCYYPPKGQRGFGPRIPSDFGRMSAEAVMKDADQNIFVGMMIETTEAVDNIEAIVNLKGLTSVVIGPSDLSIAMGIAGDLTNPKLTSAMKKVVKAAGRKGVFVGAGLGADMDYAKFLVSLGIQWLQLGSDFAYMIHCIQSLKRSFEPGASKINPCKKVKL